MAKLTRVDALLDGLVFLLLASWAGASPLLMLSALSSIKVSPYLGGVLGLILGIAVKMKNANGRASGGRSIESIRD
jgi:hypothetical protein